jgi:hypothetical protein
MELERSAKSLTLFIPYAGLNFEKHLTLWRQFGFSHSSSLAGLPGSSTLAFAQGNKTMEKS